MHSLPSSERASRDWIRRLEQDWNGGDVDACVGRLDAEVEYVNLRGGRRVGRGRFVRWLRLMARTTPGSQTHWVIESVERSPTDVVSVVAHIQVRYLRGEQVRADSLSLRLVLSAQADGWKIVGIQRWKHAYDSAGSIASQ